MHSFLSFIFSVLLLASFSFSGVAKADAAVTNEVNFFNQTLRASPFILKHYYADLNYDFLTVKGNLYQHDDNLSISEPHSHIIDLNLFFSDKILLKKLLLNWTADQSKNSAIKAVTLKEIDKRLKVKNNQSDLLFYLNCAESKKLLDKKNKITFLIDPNNGVQDLKLQVKAFGLNRNSIFKIIRYLICTRDDPQLNEALLSSLYLKGFTDILPLFKFETYENIYLPEHSLFFLPVDTDFSTDLKKTKALFQEGKYPSLEGIKPLPQQVKNKGKFLFVDQKKIRFLKFKNPEDCIKIKKIDLAK